jgi:hypothetical protein
MKHILILFLIALHLPGYSQHYYEITLSKTLNEKRLGLWATGDYKVYIELNELENYFRSRGNSFLNPDFKNYYPDSVIASFNLSAKMYLETAEQFKKAESGADLRKLTGYDGVENAKDVSGNSGEVEIRIRQLLRHGSAIAYYKGTRVFTLTARYEDQGEGLDFGYDILIYFDDEENYVLKYHEHLGW